MSQSVSKVEAIDNLSEAIKELALSGGTGNHDHEDQYYPIDQLDSLLALKASINHSHPNDHSHPNKSHLDTIDQELSTASQPRFGSINLSDLLSIGGLGLRSEVNEDQRIMVLSSGTILIQTESNTLALPPTDNPQLNSEDLLALDYDEQTTGYLNCTNGILSWQPGIGLGHQASAIIVDQKPANHYGGGFTEGAWQVRELNTINHDTIGLTLQNNQITLPIGNYAITASCPAYAVNRHQCRWLCVSDLSFTLGTTEYSNAAQTRSVIKAFLSLSSPAIYRLEHRCQETQSPTGFGVEQIFGEGVYSIVEIIQLN